MQQQTIHSLQRTLDYVFVSSMYRVASLKRNHSTPTFFLERIASLRWIEPKTRERGVAWPIQQTDRSSEQPLALLKQRFHSRMRELGCQIHSFSFALLVIVKLLPQM